MDKLFDTVLELSWQAGLIALAVMAVRLVLRKKASRRALCMLWALVALRLLLPVSLTVESPVSLQAEEAPVSRAYHAMQETRTSVPEEAAPAPAESSGAAAAVVPAEPAAEPVTLRTFARWLPWIWVIGMGCMAAYMLLSFIWMRLTLRRAEHIQDNVYRCTQWSTPFVLGIIAPCIYVPESVSEEDLPQVLAHERCHIRRWDHVVKPFAFLLLAVNWFNPVLWAAYVLLGRDMENACDEMALNNADAAQRAAYSRALVSCAAQPKMAAVCPLAFGEVAVKERVKNVLGYKKPAIWAAVMVAVAAVIIGACLLTKPAEDKSGYPLDAKKLYALRTPYVGNNSAVGAILDALGMPEMGDTADSGTYAYSIRLDTNREPMGVTVCYAFAGDVPERSAEWNRQMAQRGYIAMALIDNMDWFRWTDIDQAGTSYVIGAVYSGDGVVYSSDHAGYVDALSAARESVEGLQTYMDMLRTMAEDGSIVYYEGDAQPSFEETMPWSVTGENDPCSVRAEDYGIVYNDTLPDWNTLPLSYLCAYYLNADGAYAEGAMDVLAQRYSQLPEQVRRYIGTLSGQADPLGNGDAAEALLRDISWYITSQLTGGLPVTVSYEKDQLSIVVTQVYSVVYRTVKYDENYSEDIPVYEVGSGAQLNVIKGEGWTLYGRYSSENVPLHDGDVIDLTEQYVGLGMDGQYAVRFQYRSAAETAEKTTLSFNDNGAGMVSYPAYVFRGSGYAITVLGNAWHQMTLSSGWTDICVDGSPAINGKPAEVWQSTEDINTQLAVVHLGAMTLKEAQEWSKGAAGDGFTLTESKQGDMSGDGKNGPTEMYWTCGFYGTGSDRLAVIKTYPMAQTEHLGYALNAMAETFTLT
ncbi:MAG: M56 family metallopeptidase [Vescimonas sp.]|uniref:M56 family metallopeptidase n=1 Tax=Vescimonas sp. TaxID=2892404 RepID=UPI002A90D493|nr:M56 family metallopeptidase [Vescimonas sp.]MDY5334862.1 M56 family metallopeptidase [Vescimonas sp.]